MTRNTADAADFSALAQEISQQTYPAGSLYLVSTPIGNVGDITLRALHLLSIADAVACEDTRNTAQLLARYGLSKSLVSAHQHNERRVAEQIIELLRNGKRVALVSDAGTPAISDPGALIVDAVGKAGLRVIPLPGASAALSALASSGFAGNHFYFAGFLPSSRAQRIKALRQLESQSSLLVFYEAPHRVKETIDDLCLVFGPGSQIVIAREMTKLFEEIHRCALSDAKQWLSGNANRVKGEFVLILEPAPRQHDESEARRILSILLPELPASQAAALAARITGEKKNALYKMALDMKSDGATAET